MAPPTPAPRGAGRPQTPRRVSPDLAAARQVPQPSWERELSRKRALSLELEQELELPELLLKLYLWLALEELEPELPPELASEPLRELGPAASQNLEPEL